MQACIWTTVFLVTLLGELIIYRFHTYAHFKKNNAEFIP